MTDVDASTVAALAARLEELERTNRALEERTKALEAEIGALRPLPTMSTSPAVPGDAAAVLRPSTTSSRVGRRALVLGAAGAAAAGAAVVVGAAPAAATQGGAVILGTANDADSATTAITTSIGNGNPGFTLRNNGTGDGLQVSNQQGPSHAAIRATSGAGYGIYASGPVAAIRAEGTADGVYGSSESGVGVRGNSASGTGVSGVGGHIGVFAFATGPGSSGTGLFIGAAGPHVRFDPGASRVAPTGDTRPYMLSDLVCDTSGDLWSCVVPGTPGQWRRLSGPSTAGTLNLLPAPVRAYDSRPWTQPAVGTKTPFTSGVTRTFDLKVNNSGVPVGATGVVLTILLVNAANTAGNLTVWANGIARPAANTMVWGGAAGRFTTTALTAVDAQARIQVVTSATTDLVLDIVGYYR